MIIEFSIQNFRSIYTKQSFTMLASSARSKDQNIFTTTLASGEKLTLTKCAGVYGANASGKSNLVMAFSVLENMIKKTENIEINAPITAYQPFLFNTTGRNEPTEFEIIFIQNQLKYRYFVSFNAECILKEELYAFPKKHQRTLFTRSSTQTAVDTNIHIAHLGKELKSKTYNVHKKLPLLSIFGKAEYYHTDISVAYNYFKKILVVNTNDADFMGIIMDVTKQILQNREVPVFKQQLEKLIWVCDTQINNLVIDYDGNLEIDDIVSAQHTIFDNKTPISQYALPFHEESFGTNRLLVLSCVILLTLNHVDTLIIDEIDASLHPYISRFLIQLFLNPKSNPKNAQLIFTSHEPHLLDKDTLRADQIWFAEKTPQGETEFFSAQDFDNVREDIPFDKWYMAGKFGAVPHIQSLDFIFGDGEKTDV